MEALTGRLKALGDQTRFKLVSLLLQHDLCVGALARQLEISQAAVSQHLRYLKKHGLVTGAKKGYWTHYTVNRAAVAEAAERLAELAALQAGRAEQCRDLLQLQTDCLHGKR